MSLRDHNLDQLAEESFDVAIVGGGINGAVSASALAAKGVRTALIDRGDFAGATSQESSNLAWGGIKYLESYEFGLVRGLCKSRNLLMQSYPSFVQEKRFYATVARGFRHHPRFLWAGGWFYWLMGSAFTRPPRYLSTRTIRKEEPAIRADDLVGGFEYSDAHLHDNDARFTFFFVRSALDRGCIAANYVESTGARRVPEGWRVEARDRLTGRSFDIRASVMINAAGPYVDAYNQRCDVTTRHHHVLSKGIHLIVPQVTRSRRVLAFFASDGRLFFVIPMYNRTCIGTTDTRVERPEVEVTEDDRQFVLDNANALLDLAQPLTRGDIVAERCGVRPLVVEGDGGGEGDWMQLSRKHAVEVDSARRHISIFGGKLTDCINVGEEIATAVDGLGVDVPVPDYRWYGEPHPSVRREFFHQAKLMDLDEATASTSSEPLSKRFWRRYGARALDVLEEVRADRDGAEVLIEGTEYTRAEIRFTAEHEMVTKLEDFLRRRSKIAQVVRREQIRSAPGLIEACRIFFGEDAQARFDEYFDATR